MIARGRQGAQVQNGSKVSNAIVSALFPRAGILLNFCSLWLRLGISTSCQVTVQGCSSYFNMNRRRQKERLTLRLKAGRAGILSLVRPVSAAVPPCPHLASPDYTPNARDFRGDPSAGRIFPPCPCRRNAWEHAPSSVCSTRRPRDRTLRPRARASSVQSPHTTQPGAGQSATLVSCCVDRSSKGRSSPLGKLISRGLSEDALRDSSEKGWRSRLAGLRGCAWQD